jgi:hypothetical protein
MHVQPELMPAESWGLVRVWTRVVDNYTKPPLDRLGDANDRELL